MLHYTVNQRPHWACRQYGHSGGTRGWLGVQRCQLCLQDTSRSAKRHWRAAVGHWVSLCVRAGTLTCTFLESRSMTVENLLFIYLTFLVSTLEKVEN